MSFMYTDDMRDWLKTNVTPSQPVCKTADKL